MRNTASTAVMERMNPIMGIEGGYLVSVYGDYTAGFEVSLPEVFTLTEEEYWSLHGSWMKALRALPAWTVLHKQDVYARMRYRPVHGEDASYMGRSFQMHFAGRPYLSHRCYLYLSKTCARNARKKALFTTLCRGRIVPPPQLDAAAFDAFEEAVSQFVAILSSGGRVGLRRLDRADYLGEDGRRGLLDAYFDLFAEEGVGLSDMELRPDRIISGGKHACVYALADVDALPQQVSVSRRHGPLSTDRSDCHLSWAAPVGMNLGCDHVYNQYLFVDDPKPMLSTMASRARHMQSLSRLSRENAINARYLNDFLDLVHEQEYLPVRAHFNVVAWGDEGDFARIRNSVAAGLSQMECVPRQVTADAPVFFWSGVPGNGADFPSEETFIQFAEAAVCFFVSETSSRSSDSSFGIKLCDRFTHVPLHVDLSDEPMRNGLTTNRNKFVLGPSGSGKSFFTNHMVRQYWEQGAHILLVDTGNSYQGLCGWIRQRTGGRDGVYYTYTEEEPIAFNPFYTSDRKYTVEKRESLTTLLLTLWRKEEEGTTRSEEVMVSNAVHAYTSLVASDAGKRPSFNDFYEWMESVYAGVLQREKIREKEFDLRNFLAVLKPYYRGGQYDFLLNAEGGLDLLDKRFVVFELDNIKDHKILFPVVTLIIMETFIAKMRKLDGIRKVILIEEAWKAIAKSGMAEFIKYLFKTVRKYFGEAVVVTQEVDDILSSPIVKESIIANSDCKILLDQRKYMNKFSGIQSVLGLTDKQKAQVLSINQDLAPGLKYKEVYIDLGGQHSCVYATEVSKQENLLYTTEQTEKMRVLSAAERYGGDIETAIRDLTEDEMS